MKRKDILDEIFLSGKYDVPDGLWFPYSKDLQDCSWVSVTENIDYDKILKYNKENYIVIHMDNFENGVLKLNLTDQLIDSELFRNILIKTEVVKITKRIFRKDKIEYGFYLKHNLISDEVKNVTDEK